MLVGRGPTSRLLFMWADGDLLAVASSHSIDSYS